jgi:radical SAM protein with 4Fe4S-binding SPASM domain
MRASDRADRGTIPASVMITVTHRCQLNCEHCYQARHESDDLSTEEMLALFDELQALGTLNLTFTGGEALLRKDLFFLIAEARKRSFAVTILSNGGPITPAVAQKLRDLRVMAVEISIHGSHAATHDGFVGRQGSFERAVRAVGLLDDLGVPVLVKSNVVRCNAGEIFALEGLFAARPRVQFLTDVLLHRRDDGVPMTGGRLNSEELKSYAGERALRMTADDLGVARTMLASPPPLEQIEARHPCGAGRSFASIQPNGDVLACVQIPTMPMGNLRQKRFTEMWLDSPPVRALRALTLQKFEECRGCEYRHVCSKCPALSLSEGGKLEGHSKQICEKTKTFWGAIKERLAASPESANAAPSAARVMPLDPGCGIDAPPPRKFSLRVV